MLFHNGLMPNFKAEDTQRGTPNNELNAESYDFVSFFGICFDIGQVCTEDEPHQWYGVILEFRT